jgi:hypothetical protein
MGTYRRYLEYRIRKFQKRLIRAFCSKLYRDKNKDIENSILIAGTGRSGTTWLADIIASQKPYRIMFEPFHSEKIIGFSRFHYFQYMRPTQDNKELYEYCHNVFTGNIKDSWIDRQIDHLNPRYRLIKDIRANLFLKWISEKFPQLPILFIVRHPCAVVLSRMKLGWATDTDIAPLLEQTALVDDFLFDKMKIIHRSRTDEEKHAVIWCISNLVPLKQFSSGGLNIFFYENLCLQPEVEIPKIFQAVKHEYQASAFDQLKKPSTTTTRNSAVITGVDKVTRWQRELGSKQTHKILSIVENFELDYIYGGSANPVITTLKKKGI